MWEDFWCALKNTYTFIILLWQRKLNTRSKPPARESTSLPPSGRPHSRGRCSLHTRQWFEFAFWGRVLLCGLYWPWTCYLFGLAWNSQSSCLPAPRAGIAGCATVLPWYDTYLASSENIIFNVREIHLVPQQWDLKHVSLHQPPHGVSGDQNQDLMLVRRGLHRLKLSS